MFRTPRHWTQIRLKQRKSRALPSPASNEEGITKVVNFSRALKNSFRELSSRLVFHELPCRDLMQKRYMNWIHNIHRWLLYVYRNLAKFEIWLTNFRFPYRGTDHVHLRYDRILFGTEPKSL